MANLSDATGTITVERVGKEFLEYLNTVQGEKSDAYYTLVDRADLMDAAADEKGNLSMMFSTFGRWDYGSNIQGYLQGTWMSEVEDKKAYNKFIKALKKKGGVVDIEYTDCDTAMDWMGSGGFRLHIEEGKVTFSEGFEEENITVIAYAKMSGISEIEAVEYLHGDDVANEYDKYVEDWKKNNTLVKGETEPAGPSEWYDNVYQGEE